MRQETIDWAIEKFGPNTVLLPVVARKKGCFQKGFTKLTPACMSDPAHLAKLRGHGNLGVALGHQSDGLASIDIDLESEVERFLDLNPPLRDTLRSTAKRGCNLWLRIAGEAPGSTAIKLLDGTPWGEWRFSGNLTIVAGIHPSGIPYRVLDPTAPVVTIEYAEIVWPENQAPPRRPAPPSSSSPLSASTYPLPSTHLPPTPYTSTPPLLFHSAEEAVGAPTGRLEMLYDRYVLEQIIPRAGARNAAIVELAPKLVFAVSKETAIALLMMFFDRHRTLWKGERDRHEYEVTHIVNAAVESFEAELRPEERELYHVLPRPCWKEAFRICRSLAAYSGLKAPPPPVFHLAHDQLELRIGEHSKTCGNILSRFCQAGILTIEKPGVKRAKGVQGVPTHYRWNLG